MRIFLTKLYNLGGLILHLVKKGEKMDLMQKARVQFKEIFGDKKIDLVCDQATESDGGLITINNPRPLSEETKKKVEEQMFKNFIKDAREKGGL